MQTLGASLVLGIPGSGKSKFSMEQHDLEPNYSIFINTMKKDFSVGPYVTRFDDDAAKLWAATGHIVLNPVKQNGLDDENFKKSFEDALEYIGNVFGTGQYGICRVWVDETDEFSRCYTHNSPCEKLFTKFRNMHVLGVAITQSHSGLVSAIIKKNCHSYYVFRLHPGEFADAQRFYGLPANPPLYAHYRYELGELFYVDKDGNETHLGKSEDDDVEGILNDSKEVGETSESNPETKGLQDNLREGTLQKPTSD